MTNSRAIIVAARQVLEVEMREHRAAAAQANALLVLGEATATPYEKYSVLSIVEKASRENAAAAAKFHEAEAWRYEVAIGAVIMAGSNRAASIR